MYRRESPTESHKGPPKNQTQNISLQRLVTKNRDINGLYTTTVGRLGQSLYQVPMHLTEYQ
jgi:hypothetical protein